jgi:predicted TIM-barrel fold metal-dependent hydrolase
VTASSANAGAPACAGPDPHPRPPRQAIPAGAVDCHAHVFGPSDRFAFAARRSYTPPDAPLERYLAMLDAVGLARGVLVQPSVYGTDNACMIDAIARSGGRLRGAVVADPRQLSDATVADWTAKGVCGLRINGAVPDGLPLDQMERIAARLKEIGWHLDLITDTSDRLVELEPRLRRLPCPLMIEQMGRIKGGQPVTTPGFQVLLRLLAERKATVKLSHAYHISTAGPPYADTTPLARACIAAAPDRCVWGSDWPHPMLHGPMPNDGQLLDLLAEWEPDAARRKAILVDNPAAFYGFA